MFNKESQVAELIETAAADLILPRFNALANHEVQEKSPGDLVTVADIEVEHFLSEELPKLLPGSRVVGEEAYSNDHTVLDHLSDDGAVWLIDPVDGTVNFAHGRETFCVMAALVIRGEPVMSWIYDPLSAGMAFAEKGGGTYWNGDRLFVPVSPSMENLVGQINYAYFDPAIRPALKKAANSLFGKISRLGCAGHDFLAQVRGTRHFALYRRLWSWDHVPGSLLLKEAGGKVACLSGADIHPGDRVQGLITASSPELWMQIKDFLEKHQD